jgi:hypothetical protein
MTGGMIQMSMQVTTRGGWTRRGQLGCLRQVRGDLPLELPAVIVLPRARYAQEKNPP